MRHATPRLHERLRNALLGAILLLLSSAAAADSLGFNTLTFGNAIDGGASYGWTIDGNFDALTDTYDPVLGANILKVTRSAGSDQQHQLERRAVWEFQVPALLKQPGVTITGATFSFKKSSYGTVTLTGADVLKVSGYAGDGTVTLGDFAQVATPVWSTQNNGGPYFDADVTSYFASIAASASHVGFVVAVDSWETEYQLDSNVSMTVQYTVSGNAPPVVTIASPASGSQFTAGAAITFTGSSVDPEGGPVSAINWSSSLSGYIGSGDSVTTSALPAGTHTVSAYSQDNLNQVAHASVTLTVVAPPNAPPTVTITAPAANAQFTAGTPITFQGAASDPEGGPVSAISWSSSISGFIGTGSSVSTSSLPVGTHTILATTTDNAGQSGQASRTITVVAAPPPSAYCDARGTSSSYEYAKTVTIGNWSFTSGNNGGYGNYTALAPVPVSTGANSVTLTPGFTGGAYTEQWRVWIDLNHDFAFTADELVFSGSGSTAVSGTMNVPSTALTGNTRMRVAMSYGSGASPCGSFGYGEVEDYTVNVSVGAPPPPPPPPPPATYCASKGGTSSYEWIQQVAIAGVTRSSGNNAGYADFTSAAALNLSRSASNAVAVTPGFSSGSYTESWRVWIDFNHDAVFSDSEIVYSGTSSGALSSAFSVPSTALSGTTRMRVSMAYGSAPPACGTFSYGEVEDYTVGIP